MQLPYFYEKKILPGSHILSEETTKHCLQVLRMKTGGQMQITDGKGNLFMATITHISKTECMVNMEKTPTLFNIQSNIFIAISLLKNPSRFEWFLEKATEIGVKEIIPLTCDHTEKENFRYDRMHNILVSAMLQSRQTFLPVLHQPKIFKEIIHDNFDGLKLIAYCSEEEKKTIKSFHSTPNSKLILIGPEGDFSKQEIVAALENNFIPVSLGNTRLRSETAGIVAVTVLSGG